MDAIKLLGFTFTVIAAVQGLGTDLSVIIQNDGSYGIVVSGQLWLTSGPAFFNKDGQRWSTDTDLMLKSVVNVSGLVDKWTETQFTYSYGNGSDTVRTAIRTYKDKSQVVFTQTFLTESNGTSLGGKASFNETMSGFPSFVVADGQEELGFLSFGGYMFGDTDKTTGKFTNQTDNINDGISGGPLALFNKKGQAIVISPLDNFMAASLWHDGKPGGHVTWGIMGGVDSIPANFTYRTILYFDNSINSAFFAWGGKMREQFGVFSMIYKGLNQSHDDSLNYLGYWTDNGAYYYYNTEANTTYGETIKDVKRYAEASNIPYKYVQLDSWWYPKDPFYNAVTSWTPMSSVFPNGLKNLSDSTGWKFVAHNRYWSKKAVYAKQNNGSFDWIIGQYGSLPNDLEFWRYLFKQAKEWGLMVYEQDWLNIQTRYMAALQTNLTLGRDWLMQMGQAAAEQGITIQYCMATARHAYQSLEIPVVTQARVSDDYQYLRPDQWKIGVTSIFAFSMGLFPSKDTFWTMTSQPGNPFKKTEQYPELEAAVASLSKGPVGPSDGIGNTNTSLLMRCCRQDGMLLKPSSSARAIDKQIITDAFNYPNKVGEIWMAQSFVRTDGQDKEYGILFAADVRGNASVRITDLGFNVLNTGVYYPYNDVNQWKYFNKSTVINLQGCSKKNFCLYYLSPLLNSSTVTAILGEGDKWIPMATQRIDNILVKKSKVTLSLKGASGEVIPIWFIASGQLQHSQCTVKSKGNTTNCDLKPVSPMTSSPRFSTLTTTQRASVTPPGAGTSQSPKVTSTTMMTTTHASCASCAKVCLTILTPAYILLKYLF